MGNYNALSLMKKPSKAPFARWAELLKDLNLRQSDADFSVFFLGFLLFEVLPTRGGVLLEAPFQISRSGLRHIGHALEALKIKEGAVGLEFPGVVRLGGGEHVADHLAGVFPGHRHHDQAARLEVDPILPMVLIPPHMVLGDEGKAMMRHAVAADGAMVPRVVFGGFVEFRVAEFAQIVTEAVPEDAHVGAVGDHAPPMDADGVEMLEGVGHGLIVSLRKDDGKHLPHTLVEEEVGGGIQGGRLLVDDGDRPPGEVLWEEGDGVYVKRSSGD